MVLQVNNTHIYSKTSDWINTKTHKLKWKGGTPHTNVTLIADWRGLVNHRLKPWETRKALKFLTWTRMVCFLERSTHQELVHHAFTETLSTLHFGANFPAFHLNDHLHSRDSLTTGQLPHCGMTDRDVLVISILVAIQLDPSPHLICQPPMSWNSGMTYVIATLQPSLLLAEKLCDRPRVSFSCRCFRSPWRWVRPL